VLEYSWVMSSHCNNCGAILFLLLDLSCTLIQSHQQTLLLRRRACRVLVVYISINTCLFVLISIETRPFCPLQTHSSFQYNMGIHSTACCGRWCALFVLEDHAAASGLIWCQQVILLSWRDNTLQYNAWHYKRSITKCHTMLSTSSSIRKQFCKHTAIIAIWWVCDCVIASSFRMTLSSLFAHYCVQAQSARDTWCRQMCMPSWWTL